MGMWRGCQRNLLWKCETFKWEFSSPSCPCPCLWPDSQAGMCALPSRAVSLPLNSTAQLTKCKIKTPEGQTSVPQSSLEATQDICVLS